MDWFEGKIRQPGDFPLIQVLEVLFLEKENGTVAPKKNISIVPRCTPKQISNVIYQNFGMGFFSFIFLEGLHTETRV